MVLTYNPLVTEAQEIRVITILPALDEQYTTDVIRCKLIHVSLDPARLRSGIRTEGGNICFDGYVTERFPEYLHVDMTPKKTRDKSSKRSKFRFSRFRSSSRTTKTAEDEVPLGPEAFDVTVRAERAKGWEWTRPAIKPEELAENAHPRFTWGDYVALSYVWGSPNDTTEIVVQDERGDHNISIGKNLEAALRELRKLKCFRDGLHIWVDALSIDQKNIDERSEQVKRMGQIYRQAGNVVVWLGTEDQHSKGAIDYLEWLSVYYRTEILEAIDHSSDLGQVHQHREIANYHLKSSLEIITAEIRANEDTPIDPRGYVHIFHFFNRPYWRRLWIIQELSMGRAGMPLICGSRFTQWRYIRDSALILVQVLDVIQERTRQASLRLSREDAATFGEPISELAEHSIVHVATIAELAIHGHRKRLPPAPPLTVSFTSKPGPDDLPRVRGTQLMQLLSLAADARCSVSADRVFGLLELPGIKSLGITPDYKLSVDLIYTAFAIQCIQRGKPNKDMKEIGTDVVHTTSDNTTVERNGRVISQNVIVYGSNSTLDVLTLLDGFRDEGLMLPSWVPNLDAPAIRRITPIGGPWYASGYGQSMPLPEMKDLSGDDKPRFALSCKGVLVDYIDGLGAIQSLIADKVSFQVSHDSVYLQELDSRSSPLPRRSDMPPPVFQFHKTLIQTSSNNPLTDEAKAKRSLWWTLTTGSYMNDKAAQGDDFSNLLTAIPDSRPADDTPDLWLWDFVNSSADMIIAGKPLKSYFGPYVHPPIQRNRYDNAEAYDNTASYRAAAKQSMFAKTRGRRICVTGRRGMLGLVPMASQPGDKIAILIGNNRPVVIREIPGATSPLWRIIGECFIDGLMEGEAAQAGIVGGSQSIVFL